MKIYLEMLSVIGFVGIGYGLYQYDPKMMWVVEGSILLLFSFLAEHGTLNQQNKKRSR